jgi:hypothetical protein
MRTLLRPLRLGLPALAVVALALTGCSDPSSPTAPEPPPAAPSSTPTTSGVDVGSSTAGSDGLTVRYLHEGTVKTVHVEDFPRSARRRQELPESASRVLTGGQNQP